MPTFQPPRDPRTDARSRRALQGMAALVSGAAENDVMYMGADGLALAPFFVGLIPNDTITFAKVQNIATDRLLGRDTPASGDIEELTATGGLTFNGSGIQVGAFTGDVTKADGGTVLTIPANTITNAMLRDSAAVSVIGRSANSTGDPADIAIATNGQVLARVADAVAAKFVAGEIIGSSYVATDQSTTSTTLADLATADSVTFTLESAQDVFIWYLANVYQSTAGANCRDIVDIDGTDEATSQIDFTAAAANSGAADAWVFKKAALGSGSHTIKVQHAAVGGGTAHWRNRSVVVMRG